MKQIEILGIKFQLLEKISFQVIYYNIELIQKLPKNRMTVVQEKFHDWVCIDK